MAAIPFLILLLERLRPSHTIGDRSHGETAAAPSIEFVARRPSSAKPTPKPTILASPLLPLLEQELAKLPWLRVHTTGRHLMKDLAGMELPDQATPGPGLASLLCLPTPPASCATARSACVRSHDLFCFQFRQLSAMSSKSVSEYEDLFDYFGSSSSWIRSSSKRDFRYFGTSMMSM